MNGQAKQERRSGFFLLIASAILAAALPIACASLRPGNPRAFPEFGENDFVEYWAAYRLYREGRDMYDPAAVLEKERTAGWKEESPLMMWNPPWILPLIAPVGEADFDTAGAA